MGKQRRQRQKLHTPSKTPASAPPQEIPTAPFLPFLQKPQDNIFAGLDININNLVKNKLEDDVQSIKSFKSLKSEVGGIKTMPKKDKLKLRREMFLKKMDLVYKVKKTKKNKKLMKKSKPDITMTSLNDALPALQSLLKLKTPLGKEKKVQRPQKKKKAIEKANKRKSNLVDNVKLFKKLMGTQKTSENPLENISKHLKEVVEKERQAADQK